MVEGDINLLYIEISLSEIDISQSALELSLNGLRKNNIPVKDVHINRSPIKRSDLGKIVNQGLEYFYGKNLRKYYKNDLLIASDYFSNEDQWKDELKKEFRPHKLGLYFRTLAFTFGVVTPRKVDYNVGGVQEHLVINHLTTL